MTSGPGLHADERVLGGRYRLLSRIADGGMATVYLAIDERLGRRVAVKVLRADLARDEGFVGRFQREARLAAGLSTLRVGLGALWWPTSTNNASHLTRVTAAIAR